VGVIAHHENSAKTSSNRNPLGQFAQVQQLHLLKTQQTADY
jgi:hypothetical protein